MATQAQIAANRRNAQKSTGPRTTEGKARVSLNAIRHGIRAQAIVDQLQRTPLWDEEPQEFADLVQSLVHEFRPEGIYEEMCVEDIAINYWRLRRVARAETGYIASAQRDVQTGLTPNNPRLHARAALPKFEVLEKLNRYETSIRRQLDRARDTLAHLQATRVADLKRQVAQQREIASIRRDVIRHFLAQSNSSDNFSEAPLYPLDGPNEPDPSESPDAIEDGLASQPPRDEVASKHEANTPAEDGDTLEQTHPFPAASTSAEGVVISQRICSQSVDAEPHPNNAAAKQSQSSINTKAQSALDQPPQALSPGAHRLLSGD